MQWQTYNPKDIPEANNFETRPQPISSKQMHGICSAQGQAVNSPEYSLWKVDVITRISHTHSSSLFGLHFVPYYILLFMLTPLGFHNNILLRFNCVRKKGKPLKQFFVWEVPLSQVWNVLPEYGEQSSMRGVPIRLECTARTCWICLFRIYLELTLNLNKTIFFPVLFWDS